MRVSRLRALNDGSLTDRQVFGPDSHRGCIDEIIFDPLGNFWGIHIMLDRIFAITPNGAHKIILDYDNGSETGKKLLAVFDEGRATAEVTLACGGKNLP